MNKLINNMESWMRSNARIKMEEMAMKFYFSKLIKC